MTWSLSHRGSCNGFLTPPCLQSCPLWSLLVTAARSFFLNLRQAICLFLTRFWLCWDLHGCMGAFPRCREQGLLSSCGAPALECAGSAALGHGLSRPEVYGTFPDQGWNWCPLCWQAVSLPLDYQGSPHLFIIVCLPFLNTVSPPLTSILHIFSTSRSS